MTCRRIPTIHGIICFTDCSVSRVTTKNGKVYRFEFDRQWGPLVVTAKGEPVERQPGERSPFWPAFNAWLKRRERRKAKP